MVRGNIIDAGGFREDFDFMVLWLVITNLNLLK